MYAIDCLLFAYSFFVVLEVDILFTHLRQRGEDLTCLVAWVWHFFLFFIFGVREIEDQEVEHCNCEEERFFFRRLMQENRRDGGVLPMYNMGNVWDIKARDNDRVQFMISFQNLISSSFGSHI